MNQPRVYMCPMFLLYLEFHTLKFSYLFHPIFFLLLVIDSMVIHFSDVLIYILSLLLFTYYPNPGLE